MENTTDNKPEIRTQVIAKYRGEVIGYFDNADDAQAAIDAREAEDEEN